MAPSSLDTFRSSLMLISKRELLLKQKEQQLQQHDQFQALMQKHRDEKQHMDALLLQGAITIASKAHLYTEMEKTHAREILELQEIHQSEQTEMMDLVFEGASSATSVYQSLSNRHDQARGKSNKQSGMSEITSQASEVHQPAPSNNALPRRSSTGETSDMKKKKHVTSANRSDYVQKLNSNKNPSLRVMMLDGRREVSNEDWTAFFDSMERNTHLTHLSVANCGLDNDVCLHLILALVENETLSSLNLSNNSKLTDASGKLLLKVLQESNSTLTQVNIDGTKISSKMSRKIQSILDLQIKIERRRKVEDRLASSKKNRARPSSSRQCVKLEREEDTRSTTSKSTRSTSSASLSDRGMNKTKLQQHLDPSESFCSSSSLDSSSKSASSNHRMHSKSRLAAQASRRRLDAAQAMANFGNLEPGKNFDEVRKTREARGECPGCGQRCFRKTLFKSVTLMILNKVHEGKCLKCAGTSLASLRY